MENFKRKRKLVPEQKSQLFHCLYLPAASICVSGYVHQLAARELRQHGHRYWHRMPSLSRHSLSPALPTSWSNHLAIFCFSIFKEVVWVTPLYDIFQGLHTTRKPQGCFMIFSTLGVCHSEQNSCCSQRNILTVAPQIKIEHTSFLVRGCTRRVWSTYYKFWKESKTASLADLFREASSYMVWMLVMQGVALG